MFNDKFNDSLSEIQDELDDLNDVIDIYNENGYLSAEQASDLCQKNEDYAKYLVKTADGYELTSDAIDRRNVLEGDQADTVDLLIEKTMNSTYKDDLRNLRNILNDDSFFSYNEFINTVNIIYSKNLITKSSRNRLLRINEKKKAKGGF